jgi:hypothetical protein
VEYHLVEVPSTGRPNRPGGRSNRLRQERHRKPKIAAPGGTPSGTMRIGLFKSVLTLFSVEHMSALDRAVVEYHLVEVPSTGRSNRPGQERRRKPKIAAPGGTPSVTTRLGSF